MGKKVCENADCKRELLYSLSSLVFTPVLWYFAVTGQFQKEFRDGSEVPPVGDGEGSDGISTEGKGGSMEMSGNETDGVGTEVVIKWIIEKRELPVETVFYVVAFEILKLLIVFIVFPGSHLFDQSPSLQAMWSLGGQGSHGNSGGKGSQGRLPFSKRDSSGPKAPSLQVKIMEIWKGFCNFTAGCVVCHVFIVLMGAPILENCKLTFQFSIILTSWMLSPLCLAVQPSRVLQELVFISLWNTENEVLHRSKWKFVVTVFGAWIGAIVIPLDWDRPWQKWPIPCLASTVFTYLVSNLVLTIHLLCTIFGVYHKIYMISTESNKIKNF